MGEFEQKQFSKNEYSSKYEGFTRKNKKLLERFISKPTSNETEDEIQAQHKQLLVEILSLATAPQQDINAYYPSPKVINTAIKLTSDFIDKHNQSFPLDETQIENIQSEMNNLLNYSRFRQCHYLSELALEKGNINKAIQISLMGLVYRSGKSADEVVQSVREDFTKEFKFNRE